MCRDDAVLQTRDSKFEPWQSEAEHATFRSRRLPTRLTFTREWGRNIFVSFKPPRPGTEPRTQECGAFVPLQYLMQLIGSNERIFGIYLNRFYIGVIQEIKLSRSSKIVHHMQIVNVSR